MVTTPFQRIGVTSLTGAAAALSIFLAGIFAAFMPLTALYLVIITAAVTYFSLKYRRYFYSLFLINLSAIVGSCIVPTFHENLIRALIIIVLTVLMIFMQILILPGFIRKEMPYWTRKSLRDLNLVIKEVFTCFIQPEYADNVYLFEKRLHVKKRKYLFSICCLREIEAKDQWPGQAEKIDDLFDIIMDCAQLRRRVSDHTVFALCSKELSGILAETDKLFREMMRATTHFSIDTIPLTQKINLFENTFESVLRVVAREPLAFLLFIASLKAFREKVALYA